MSDRFERLAFAQQCRRERATIKKELYEISKADFGEGLRQLARMVKIMPDGLRAARFSELYMSLYRSGEADYRKFLDYAGDEVLNVLAKKDRLRDMTAVQRELVASVVCKFAEIARPRAGESAKRRERQEADR